MVMHDVDLVPMNFNLPYGYAHQPTHIAAPWLREEPEYLNFS
jgi:hypothetical protein